MSRFFTSDTHFGHKRIIELCNRPFRDVDHMNEEIISRWNAVVSPEDEVFHLGDVALGPWAEWNSILTRLNGHLTLVVGNHDRIFLGNEEKMRNRFEPIYANWFEWIMDQATGIPFWNGETNRFVNLSHFPYDGDSHGEERYREFRLEDKGLPLVHGHTHDPNQWFTKSKKGTPMFHVGMDAHNFTPVHEDVIIDWLGTLW